MFVCFFRISGLGGEASFFCRASDSGSFRRDKRFSFRRSFSRLGGSGAFLCFCVSNGLSSRYH